MNSQPKKNVAENRTVNEVSRKNVELFFESEGSKGDRQEKIREARKNLVLKKVVYGVEEREELRRLEESFGMVNSNDKKGQVLSEEEEVAYQDSITEFRKYQTDKKDHAEVCRVFMGSIKERTLFKTYYEKWKVDYEERKKSDPEFARGAASNRDHFKNYINDRGVQFVTEISKVIRRERIISSFRKESVEVGVERDDEKKIDVVVEKIEVFIAENLEKIRSGKDNDALFQEFASIFSNEEKANISSGELRNLFNDLVLNSTFEYLSIQEYESISSVMLLNVNKQMTDEEWAKLLDDTLKEKAKGELKDYLDQRRSVGTVSGGGLNAGNFDQLCSLVEDMGRSSGVKLEPTGERGVYYISFNTGIIEDKGYRPKIRIIDSNNFQILSEYQDDKENKKYEDFQRVINEQHLEYVINMDSKTKIRNTASQNINSVINDAVMRDMAESLFGFNLNEKPLSRQYVERFQRLIKILLNDNGKEGFKVRVEKMRVFLRDRNKATLVMNLLWNRGSEIFDIDKLIERANFESRRIGIAVG
jgi:hypothetical protein